MSTLLLHDGGEAPAERSHVAAMMLRYLLLLPDDVTVAAVHFDPIHDAVVLRLEGSDKLPATMPGQTLTRVNAVYRKRLAELGDQVTEFVSF